jgi:hypothetical protein
MIHSSFCQADTGHTLDCATATELARLRAFAEAVRDEWQCTLAGEVVEEMPADHVDDCWHCYATQALERVR